MTTAPTRETVEKAVLLAGRAPSLHNSQPWRWVFDGTELQLFAVPERTLAAADPTGRQLLLSCGIALDHLRAAMAAAGWRVLIARFPDPNQHHHLATVRVEPSVIVTEAERDRADAIVRRHSDRLPFAAPSGWDDFEIVLRSTFNPTDATVDILPPDSRAALAHASELSAALRRYDSSYQAELQWWAGHVVDSAGIPRDALVTAEERVQVAVGRRMPAVDGPPRRAGMLDNARILVLSTDTDLPLDLLRCGEVLSTVLLECTLAGYATCPLTHLTEFPRSRAAVRELTGRTMLPQALLRVGAAPDEADDSAPTPRRPLADILQLTGSVAQD